MGSGVKVFKKTSRQQNRDIAMKSYRLFVPLVSLCLASAIIQGCSTTATQKASSRGVSEVFPPVPNNLANFPTISEPTITVTPDVATSLGSMEVTNMAATFIGDLLVKSGRFTLIESGYPDCECHVRLTGFRIQQINKRYGLGRVFPALTNLFPKLATYNQLTNIDWSKKETEMNILCSVSMRIIAVNSHLKAVIAAGDANINQTDTTKNITAEIVAFSEHTGTTNEVAIKSSLIDLASYEALTNMLPELDLKLPEWHWPTPGEQIATNAPIGSVKPVRPSSTIPASA